MHTTDASICDVGKSSVQNRKRQMGTAVSADVHLSDVDSEGMEHRRSE